MSLRARLALVLAGALAGPVAAAALVVGVVVPRAQADAARGALGRAAATAAAALAQGCVTLGDVGRATALDIAGSVAVGRPVDAGVARRAAAAALRGHDDVGLLVVVDGGVVARAGALPAAFAGAATGTGAAGRAEAGALRAAQLASCSRGLPPPTGGPALVETVALPAAAGPAVRVVALRMLDPAAVAQLRSRLALDADVAMLPVPAGTAAADTAGAPGPIAAAVRAGRAGGVAGGLRYEAARVAAGVPYQVVAWAPAGDPAPGRLLLLALVLAAVAAGALLLAVVPARLTSPLHRLAGAADRLRAGDLDARTDLEPARADGDVDLEAVAAALDDMAGRLQGSQDELRRSRAAQADAAARFGEALDRTHDLDALLQTVLDAACAGLGGVGGVALLGADRTLEERATRALGDDPLPGRTVAALARLGRGALTSGQPVVAGPGEVGAPAVAVPLRSRDRVLGALAVTRNPGGAPVTPADVAGLADLARHAGAAVANALAHEETRRLSVTDPLTGAGNFRQLSTTLAREVERATRFNRPLSVVMLDLDHFKAVNDAHGHPFGDAVLREFARRLQDCLREVDTVTRYGGEEFTVVLPETGADGAGAVAARIVRAVRDLPFTVGSRSAEVTVSAGVASFPDHGRTASDVLRAADAALYVAKGAGRDRWCMAEVAVPGLDPDDRDDERNDGDVPGLEGVGAARPRDAG